MRSLGLLVGVAVAACGGGASTGPTTVTPVVVAATPPAPTPEIVQAQTAAKVAECSHHAEARDFAKLADCYTDRALGRDVDHRVDTGGEAIANDEVKPFYDAFSDFKATPVLLLVNAHQVASITLLTGTHDGRLWRKDPTHKKLGLYAVRAVEVDADGKIASDERMIDFQTWNGQLGWSKTPHRAAIEASAVPAPIVVAAKHDQKETDNLAVVNNVCAAYNKHDLKAIIASYAANAVWSDATATADLDDPKDITAVLEGELTAFPDFERTCAAWAAGDYVFNAVYWTGMNTGAMPPLLEKATGKPLHIHIYEVYQLGAGKVTRYWRFSNGESMRYSLGLIGPGTENAPPKAEPPPQKGPPPPKVRKAPKAKN